MPKRIAQLFLAIALLFGLIVPFAKVNAAGVTMSWASHPSSVNLAQEVSLAGTVTNNSGSSFNGSICRVTAIYERDSGGTLGPAFNFTSVSAYVDVGDTKYYENTGSRGQTAGAIAYVFTTNFPIQNGQAGSFNAKVKVSSQAQVGDKIKASLNCDNGSDIPTSSTVQISVVSSSDSSGGSPSGGTTQPKPKTTTTVAAPLATPPAAPTISKLNIDGVETDATKPIELNKDQSLVLSGQTVAKGLVSLYIYSEPQKATVTADDQGNWSHTISGLEPGEHRVEAEVTDPTNGKTSEKKELIRFSVLQATAASEPVLAQAKNPEIWSWLLLILVVLAPGGYFGWKWWQKRQKTTAAKKGQSPTEEITPPEEDSTV